MTAHVLNFNPQTGIPKLETFASRDQMMRSYRGYPQGLQITTPAELEAAKETYRDNQWAAGLLSRIDPKALEEK